MWGLNDFHNKYGFGDGSTVPAQAEAYRYLYCTLFNAHAKRKKVPIRCFVYDRTGIHNPFILMYINEAVVRKYSPLLLVDPLSKAVEVALQTPEAFVSPYDSRVQEIYSWIEATVDINALIRITVNIAHASLDKVLKATSRKKVPVDVEMDQRVGTL